MTPTEQDEIDFIVDFKEIKKRGITAKVNAHNTVMRATTMNDVAVFNGIKIDKHIRTEPSFYRTIKSKYPLLELVLSVDEYSTPCSLLHKHDRVLIAEYDGFVIAVAPMVTQYIE